MLPLHLVNLHGVSILEQLKWEEALLRADNRNWCLFNYGSPPAIVMGISGQFDELIDQRKLRATPLPVIRRFSGGGTVVIDPQTIFITFIFNSKTLSIAPFPLPIMQWTESLYYPLFKHLPFSLRENDYVLAEKKIGGNAQSITKNRWLHHSSFLFNFCPRLMDLLFLPSKAPLYREKRTHADFLSHLSLYWPTIHHFRQDFFTELQNHFRIMSTTHVELELIAQRPHRQATTILY